MGNQHSAAHALKPRKNVQWKSAGRPATPGRPEAGPAAEEGAVALRWAPAGDGGAPLLGYQVECRLAHGGEWLRTAPPLVNRPELVLAELPSQRYQFRVAALSAAGVSDYSPISPPVGIGIAGPRAPRFTQPLHDVCTLEGDAAEFHVTFDGTPPPNVAWFKDDYEIFSSRRTAITTGDGASVLVFHQTLASDEGEVKCTATNRAGHAVSRARLRLEAPPRLRYSRQYEDGLLYEVNETIYLKTTVVGRPTPTVEWLHDGCLVTADARVQLAYTGGVASLKILSAQRSDRGEYQVRVISAIGEDTAAFLVTVTAPPESPSQLTVVRQLDRSVTLRWQPPADDGGCRVGSFVVEYFRMGWDVWLKATTSRQPTATLFDLIEGSEYRFRVKAESPYGMSAPSEASAAVRMGGAQRDPTALALEARILARALRARDGDEVPQEEPHSHATSNEFLLVLCPPTKEGERRASVSCAGEEIEKGSYDEGMLEGEEPPPLSLSAPELSARAPAPWPPRLTSSSTDLLHERAMLRMYHAVALRDQRAHPAPTQPPPLPTAPREPNPPHLSFEEDYTASTVSTEYSEEEPASLEQSPPPTETPPPPPDTPSPTPPAKTPPRTLPDPTFVPKPILKRREPDAVPPEQAKKNKHEKTSIFKKFTKMPMQKPFLFPKILNKKQIQKGKPPTQTTEYKAPKKKLKHTENNTMSEETVIVIEHYGNIVKEYGGQRRPTTPLYLDTEELKNAAERQSVEEKQEMNTSIKPQEDQRPTGKGRSATRGCGGKRKPQSPGRGDKPAVATATGGPRRRVMANSRAAYSVSKREPPGVPPPASAAVLLRTAPRATLMIPIDYAVLEQQATVSVRTTIDCTVDACLLVLAFYLYLFRDERLTLGPLALLASRQLRAALRRIPHWLRVPAWLRPRPS